MKNYPVSYHEDIDNDQGDHKDQADERSPLLRAGFCLFVHTGTVAERGRSLWLADQKIMDAR